MTVVFSLVPQPFRLHGSFAPVPLSDAEFTAPAQSVVELRWSTTLTTAAQTAVKSTLPVCVIG